MIPQDFISEWKKAAPWSQNDQVEQDLIISRALVEIFSHPILADNLANWTVLADSTNTATDGVWHYTATNHAGAGSNSTAGPNRWFRARAVNPCP